MTTTGDATPARWVENAATTSRFASLQLGETWRHRELAYFFALRDIKVRYKQALLGAAWALLQPLAGAAAFTLVFHNLADIDVQGRSYFGFALTGYVAWAYFSAALLAGMNSLLFNSDLLTKVSFPRLLLPVAAILPPLVDLLVGAVVALVVALALGDGFGPVGFLVGLPLGLALLVAAVLGPALLLSATIARYRDVGAIATFGLQFVLFASPVAYPSELVPDQWRDVYYLNPVAGALGLIRGALTNADLPSAGHLVLSAAVALVLCALGLAHFQASARHVADVI